MMLALPALAWMGPASAAGPDISLSPASLSFAYQVGAALPAFQSLQVKATSGSLAFTISTSGPAPYNGQWLSVSANSGTATATVKVYVNPTGLPTGSYGATITVSSPSAATPTQTVPVTLDVADPAPALAATPTTMSFAYVTGGAAPANQTIGLTTSGDALTVTAAVSGSAWLTATPAAATALMGLPAAVTVTANPAGLAPGPYSGVITFTSSTAANKSVTVAVTLTVAAGNPVIAAGGVWPPGVVVGSQATTITVTGAGFFGTSVASATTASSTTTPLATTVLSPTTLLATIPPALLGTAGTLSITISTPSAAAASAPATFTVWGPGPQVWAATNAASYSVVGISPGELISIFGVGLGPAVMSRYSGTSPLPVSLPATGPATSVTIDGVAAPLLFTSASQINCIAPYEIAGKSGTTVNVVVTYNSIASTAFKVSVVDADPGVFTVNYSGDGQGAILNVDTSGNLSVNSSANAAARGSNVVIYLTGFGQTTPAGDETQLIASAYTPAATITASIGGQAATVQSTSVPMGSVPGLLEATVTVPASVTPGNAVSVVVSVGSDQSQARVTMAVK